MMVFLFLFARDPFLKPALIFEQDILKSELESVPFKEFKLLGVLTQNGENRAMVSHPNGKTFFVKKNDKIGNFEGVVQSIDLDGMLVKEKKQNENGEWIMMTQRKSIDNGGSL